MKQSQTIEQTIIEQIPLKDIRISPFNDRWGNKPPNEETLLELADSIKTHDVIQAVLLRPTPEGKYELVVGERRFRASKMAGKKTINATVKVLTDEEVQEIQLIENMQREDPHPMSEALAIQKLLALSHIKNRVEEVANRIGKSPAYVYKRVKLCDLIETFREIYLSNQINTTQALKLARLDMESQTDFFESYCKQGDSVNIDHTNFDWRVRKYQLDLKKAPFNIKDAKLDKSAGACTKCQFNTAVTSSLFPEESKEARCTNRKCFQNKCRLFALLHIAEVLINNPELPVATDDESILTAYFSGDDSLIKGRKILVREVDFYGYDSLPELPNRSDFEDYEEQDENEAEFQQAMEDYQDAVKEFNEEVAAGTYQLAILITENTAGEIVGTYQEPQHHNMANHSGDQTPFRAKDYQVAVKAKTLTLELVEAEKQRLLDREERSKEIDEDKLQQAFIKSLIENDQVFTAKHPVGTKDRAAVNFVLFNSLNFQNKQKFTSLILDNFKSKKEESEKLIEFFFKATDNQVSVLTRLAMLNISDTQFPNQVAGRMLRFLVEGTEAIDHKELENIQRTVTKEREVKLAEKLAILEKQKEKL